MDFENVYYFLISFGPQISGFPGPQISTAWPRRGLGWAGPGLSHLDQQMLTFYHKYWCLSSRPPVSCRRDESKCHQVYIFPDQHERQPAVTSQGPLPTPLKPLVASSVWGTTRIAASPERDISTSVLRSSSTVPRATEKLREGHLLV